MLNPQNKLFRWGPISACPLFMYFAIEPSFAPLKKLLDLCYPESLIIFKNNKVTWLLDEQEFAEQSQRFVEKVIFNSHKQQKYFYLWNHRTKTLLESFDHLEKTHLAFLSDEELVKELKKFSKVYYNWWTLTMSLELVTVTLEPRLGQKLKSYYPDEHPKEYNRAFSILTSPLVLTFYRQEQLDLLRIFSLPKGKQNKALVKHQRNFYWIYNSYLEGKILDVKYFRKELTKISDKDYQRAISEIENYPQNISEEKNAIITNIKPSREVLELITLVETFSQLQDERKMNNFRAEHHLELFVQEFSRRTKRKTADLKMLLHNELIKIMDKVDEKLIIARHECFVLECREKSIISTIGKNALVIASNFSSVQDIKETMIHGILASTGDQYYFRGIAKLVLSIKEINKIEEGDILVTTMTSPDFVIGMKKAGAIITDTGGILCHAAIISRELKKACIVGTEIATKVIHDGDVVELHCGRGTVKIIKHKE